MTLRHSSWAEQGSRSCFRQAKCKRGVHRPQPRVWLVHVQEKEEAAYLLRSRRGGGIPCGQPVHANLAFHNFSFGSFFKLQSISGMSWARCLREPTIEVTFANFISPVTATDWTRNLSLHFASRAGSSFIACNKTGKNHQLSPFRIWHQRTLNLHTLPGFNASGVGPYTVAEYKSVERSQKRNRCY